MEPKLCRKCGGPKNARYQCLRCMADRMRTRRAAEPGKHRALARESMRTFRTKHADDPGRRLSAQRKYNAAHPEVLRKSNRRHAGWAPGEHDRAEAALALLAECGCCGTRRPWKGKWCSDHDHVTKLFRGYLCQPCNLRIGFAEKSGLQFSEAEATYLLRFQNERATDIAVALSRVIRWRY